MLRVGLTGNLGSGKSTVASLFASRGAHLLASDAIGRDLMQPGQTVFDRIVAHFGPHILTSDGTLDRPALARLAFAEGRADELNAIVHPAVIARQATLAAQLAEKDPRGVLIVESALIFETKFAGAANGSWETRFDRIIVVTASKSSKIARFVHRQHPEPLTPPEHEALAVEASRRLNLQLPDRLKQPHCDYILTNDGTLEHLERQVDTLWPILRETALSAPKSSLSLQ